MLNKSAENNCPNSAEDIEWTEAQRRVIDYEGGPLQVIACAGSGKTTTISRMIAELVSKGRDKNSIVAFTFTDNAANQLKVSIKKQMQKVNPDNDTLGEMYIGTIHSFCRELLKIYDETTISYEVLSESALAAFVFQHTFRIGLHRLPPNHPNALTKKVGWFIDDANAVRRENLEEELRTSRDETAQAFYSAYSNFRQLMRNNHLFDFEELIYRTLDLLENNPDILADINHRYQYVIVDEYQDVDSAQERLICLLAGGLNNIVVVGDDDQSIYKWRGAKVDNFINFTDRHGIEPERMEENYRSTDTIIDLSREFIQSNQNRLKKSMEPGSKDRYGKGQTGDVYQIFFDEQQQEIDFIYNKIKELVGTIYTDTKGRQKNISYGDIAIFFRKKKSAQELIDKFEREGFREYVVTGEESIFAQPEAELIRRAFAYIARGVKDSISITNYEERPDRYGEYPQFIVEEDNLREVIRRSELLSGREDIILDGLNQLKFWYSLPTGSLIPSGYPFLSDRDKKGRRIYPQDEYHRILKLMGILEIEFPERLMYIFGNISSLLMDFETVYKLIFPDKIKDLVRYLDWATTHYISQINDPTLLNVVNVMTIHSSKGLEFPVVFMPSLNKRGFPAGPIISINYSRNENTRWIREIFDYNSLEENEEDTRRLFYVGMTRSRKYLFLTGGKRPVNGGQNSNESDYFVELLRLRHEKVMYECLADPTTRVRRSLPSCPYEYTYESSFSQLRYMYHCPYNFKMKHIYGFCPKIDSGFNYGFAVHNSLRSIHTTLIDNPFYRFTQEGIDEMVDDQDRFHLRYAEGKVETSLRESAKKILWQYISGYDDIYLKVFKPEVPFEYLITNEESGANILLTGSIDLLERRDPTTNRVTEVDVIDFKTEHWDGSTYDPRFRDAVFQLRLYALATHSVFGLGVTDGYIHFLTENKREQVDMDTHYLHQVESDIKQKVDNIMNREFDPVCVEEKCKSCDWSDLCKYSVIK